MLKSKIHRAKLIETDVDYEGSILIDTYLMEQSLIRPYEKVQVLDVTNGARFETYAIAGERHSGMISINGAAAHLVNKGDLLIIISYGCYTEEELLLHQPRIVIVNDNNELKEVSTP